MQIDTDLIIDFSFSKFNTSNYAVLTPSFKGVSFFEYDEGKVRVGLSNKAEAENLTKEVTRITGIKAHIEEVTDGYYHSRFEIKATVLFLVGKHICLNVD